MIWSEIIDLYRRATGESGDAIDEQYLHATHGYRKLAGMLDIPELQVPNATVNTVNGQDFVEVDCDVFSIRHISETTDGRKLDPEYGGMRGRSRYIESGSLRPPLGQVQFYVREGNKIWLRDTPNKVITLLVAFKMHPPEVTSKLLTDHPITPQQFDMALVKLAASSFFELHPPKDREGREDPGRAASLRQAAMQDISDPEDPKANEGHDHRDYVRQPGYVFGIRGR